ncbi:hypothetical protein BVRB_2g028370 [Beta vulgaris subsp. vulgaris]|nr:hypothetical protein BVRB_2g028370 [Beta vulgaris subsp. vulgaris]
MPTRKNLEFNIAGEEDLCVKKKTAKTFYVEEPPTMKTAGQIIRVQSNT